VTRLFIVTGDTAIFQLVLTNPDCSVIDLTNFGITFTLKRTNTDTDEDAIFQGSLLNGGIVIIGPETDGTIQVIIPSANTAIMRGGLPYYWDVQLEDAADKIFTPAFGKMYAQIDTTLTIS
jgi:hypothetical protein